MFDRMYKLMALSLVIMLLVVMVPATSASSPAAPSGPTGLAGLRALAGSKAPAISPNLQVVAFGLDNPRGLSFGPDGTLYVAESGVGGPGPDFCAQGPEGPVCFGTTGAVTKVANGTQSRIATGMASLGDPATGGFSSTGPSDVTVDASGNVYAIVGLGADPAVRDPNGPFGTGGINLGQLTALPGDGSWSNIVDVAAYETAANPDGGAIDSNPYSVMAMSGDFVVADAGGNDLLNVPMGGAISTIGVFPDRLVEFPPFSGNYMPMQAVPTSVTMGHDGNYLVGQLTGFPFPVGGANVFSVTAGINPEVYADGFTNVIDVAHGSDGSVYVLEMVKGGLLFANPGDPASMAGALYRVAADGTKTMLASDGLMVPGGVAVGPDGAFYVSNFSIFPGAGHVVRLPMADMVMADPDTAIAGDTVTLHAYAENVTNQDMNVLHIVPLDTNLTAYVIGSATNGAFPIGVSGPDAAQILREQGIEALKATATAESGVVAVAWQGTQAAGTEASFSFQATVLPGAAGAGVPVAITTYEAGQAVATASTHISVPALNSFEVTLQDGLSGYSGTSDATINAWEPDANYGSAVDVYVRQPNVKSLLVQFDLSAITDLAQVTDAQLGIFVPYANRAVTVDAFEVYKSWSEADTTWNAAGGGTMWEMPGANGASDRASEASDSGTAIGGGQWLWFDVSDLAQNWIHHPDMNHGVILVGTGGVNGEMQAISSDFTVSFVRPQMRLSYMAP